MLDENFEVFDLIKELFYVYIVKSTRYLCLHVHIVIITKPSFNMGQSLCIYSEKMLFNINMCIIKSSLKENIKN